MHNLEQRIARLEKSNRRLKSVLLVGLLLGIAVPLLGAGAPDDLVKRREKRERILKNTILKAHEETYARLPREYRQTLFDVTHKVLAGTEVTGDELQLLESFKEIPEIGEALQGYLHATAVKTGYYEFLRGFGGELRDIRPLPAQIPKE